VIHGFGIRRAGAGRIPAGTVDVGTVLDEQLDAIEILCFDRITQLIREALGRIEIGPQEGRGSIVRAVEDEQVILEAADVEKLDEALTALERAIEPRLP
jgi:hypothetical protein